MPSEKNINAVFTDTATAIRGKLGTAETIQPIEFADKINLISGAGNLQIDKTVNPAITTQNITPDPGFNGMANVIINPVSSSIDSNISPENIKKGVSILGVDGTLQEGGFGGSQMGMIKNVYVRGRQSRSLGEVITGDQLREIRQGTFNGMELGDYWGNPLGDQAWHYVIAGFDWYYDTNHFPEGPKHHVILIVKNVRQKSPMNQAETTSGGYFGSDMVHPGDGFIEHLRPHIDRVFGSAVLSHSIYASDETNTQGASHMIWKPNRTIDLLSTSMVISRNQLDEYFGPDKLPRDKDYQLPLFAASTGYQPSNTWYWTRDPYSDQKFILIHPSTKANSTYPVELRTSLAGNPDGGVRPYFLVG